MVFVVDIGNSNIVSGVVNDGEILFNERISTDRDNTDVEFAVLFNTILELHKIDRNDIDGAIIASVVPEINSAIKKGLDKLLNCDTIIVGPGVKTGLDIKIYNPSELGADMVVAAVAAKKEYPLPLIIFDLGTATTISAVDSNGEFPGVSILAGVNTALQSIVNKASLLTNISFEKPKHLLGKNTIESLQSGVIYGTAAMMDGMIERVKKELTGEPTIVATGGISDKIVKYCEHDIIHDENLLLKGLYEVYLLNK